MKIRKRLVVLTKFQSWFFYNFIFYIFTSLACVGVAVFLWIRIVAKAIMELVGLISDPVMTLVSFNSEQGLKIFAVLCSALLAIAFLQAYFFSRKIAGPLFALIRHFEKCERQGRFEKLNLRKGDLFIDLATTFNRTVEKVNIPVISHEPSQIPRKKIKGLATFGRD